MRQAYVTMITGGDDYVPGVEVLGQSIRESGSSEALVLMATPDVPKTALDQLASRGWDVREVHPVTNPHGDEQLFARFKHSFTKLRVFSLVDFEKVVFLDADTVVLQNVDDLFARPAIAAAPDFFMPDHFNSGVMVLTPSAELFARLMDALATAQTYDGGDQGFLNTFWPEWWEMPPAHRLSPTYNMPHFNFQFIHAHPGLRRRFLKQTKIVHYTLQKPWLTFTLTGGSNAWWQKFFSAHPEEYSRWRQGLHTIQDWSFENLVGILGND
jgi:alpha-N-acetylglucosamine transferase